MCFIDSNDTMKVPLIDHKQEDKCFEYENKHLESASV